AIKSARPAAPDGRDSKPPRGRTKTQAAARLSEKAAWHLCLEDQGLCSLEKDLVEAVAGPALVFVPRDPVAGLDRQRLWWGPGPGSPALSAAPSSDAERLPWLFDPSSAPPPLGDGTLKSFRAVGPGNECREIFRRIAAGKTRFDEVEVIHPPGPAYPAIFHLLAERARLPLTYARGIPVSFTSPGRVFAGLADWLQNDYLAADLSRLVEAGDLELLAGAADDSSVSLRISLHLRRAMIGWGRERYIESLTRFRAGREADLDRPPHGDDEERSPAEIAFLRRDVEEIGRLTEAVGSFLALFPEAGQSGNCRQLDFPGLCEGLRTALETKVRLRSELDRQALEVIVSELRKAAGEGPASPGTLDRDDALDRLRTLVTSLTVGSSSPLPGHLHVSSFDSGGFSGRPETYIVGLTDSAFPGPGPQDPVLLDSEREAISPFLPTTADALKSNLYAMAVLLSSLRGSAVWGFRIDGVLHEHQTIPGVVEDVHQIIGNLKTLTLSLDEGVENTVLRITKNAAGPVTAADIEGQGGVTIVDRTQHLFTLQGDREINVELYVGRGRGYVEADQHVVDKTLPVDVVRIDSIYNPVRRANFAVAETRVGQRTDYDRLTLTVETNG
ncbi:MAG: hypothetical protein ACXVI6_08685, partial [Candidatus Aminicenantales bacterium]